MYTPDHTTTQNLENGLETVSADRRLIGLADDGSGQFTLLTSAAKYRCAACNALTTFDVRQKSSQAARMREFTEAMGSLTAYEKDYCDFDCSGCGEHVRLVYSLTEVSMAHYHYYPNTLYVYPPTDGFAIQATSSLEQPPKRWLYLTLMIATLAGIFALAR